MNSLEVGVQRARLMTGLASWKQPLILPTKIHVLNGICILTTVVGLAMARRAMLVVQQRL